MKIKKNGKVINLTESDLRRIVKRVLSEQEESNDENKSGEQEQKKTSEETKNLDKKGCIKHIKEKLKEVNSSGDRIKWKKDNPKSVESIESCLKTHYKTFQKEGIFKAGDEAKKLIDLLDLEIEKPQEVVDKTVIQIKDNKGRVVMFVKNVKDNKYRFRGKKGEVIFDSARSGGIGKVKYFDPGIETALRNQMKLDSNKKITINKGLNTKGLDLGSFTIN